MSNDVVITNYAGLDQRVSIIRRGGVVDAAFIRTERFDVMIDTLDTPEACAAALAILRRAEPTKPLVVVNSHMDWDHFWGNGALERHVPIMAHEAAVERFHAPEARSGLARKQAEDPRFRNVQLVPPTTTFMGTARLHGGDLTLHIFPTPGHTPDHVSIWIPEIKTCIAGDAVEDPIPEVWSDDPDDLASLMSSLEAIDALNAEHLIIAHGQANSASTLQKNIEYFKSITTLARSINHSGARGFDPSQHGGLRFSDLVRPTKDLSPYDVEFYERCHERNLRAALRSCSTVPSVVPSLENSR